MQCLRGTYLAVFPKTAAPPPSGSRLTAYAFHLLILLHFFRLFNYKTYAAAATREAS